VRNSRRRLIGARIVSVHQLRASRPTGGSRIWTERSRPPLAGRDDVANLSDQCGHVLELRSRSRPPASSPRSRRPTCWSATCATASGAAA